MRRRKRMDRFDEESLKDNLEALLAWKVQKSRARMAVKLLRGLVFQVVRARQDPKLETKRE